MEKFSVGELVRLKDGNGLVMTVHALNGTCYVCRWSVAGRHNSAAFRPNELIHHLACYSRINEGLEQVLSLSADKWCR